MNIGLNSSPSRRVIWQKVRSLKTVSAVLVATALGAGLLPIAPGTMGTLAAMPLAYFLRDSFWGARVIFWVTLTLLGIWSARVFDQTMETQDNQNIVIDEVIGLGITSWTAGSDFKTWIAAFVLFRFFDVLKPFPVRQIDQWSKKRTSRSWDGVGVILDDAVAGFQGLAVILFLQWLRILG